MLKSPPLSAENHEKPLGCCLKHLYSLELTKQALHFQVISCALCGKDPNKLTCMFDKVFLMCDKQKAQAQIFKSKIFLESDLPPPNILLGEKNKSL